MHLWSIAATVLLIAESACQASAHSLSSTVVDISNLYHLGHRRIDRQIRENTGPILNHEFYHVRPIPTIAGTPPSTTPSVATPAGFSDIEPPILNHGLYRTGAGRESSTRSRALVTRQTRFMDASQEDPTTWNNATDKACMNALSAMHGNASNPAGMAVCYNIPFLNTSTGVFQADMRLYRVAGPVKEWAAIQDQTVSIRLFYPSATVSPRKLTIGRRADYSQFWRPEATAVATELNILRKEGNTPQMLQAFGLIGQIKGDLLAQATDQITLQDLVIPDITISATSPRKRTVTASLSLKEASFVNGVFAGQSSSLSSPHTSAFTSAVTGNVIKFEMPGTTLGIFPIGLIITASWAGVLVGVVGYGTVGRLRFRQQYRRRVRRELARAAKRI